MVKFTDHRWSSSLLAGNRWVVYHETYTFCLASDSFTEPDLDPVPWLYQRQTREISQSQDIMLMQPGELHANKSITRPGTFVVLQVDPHLFRRIATQIGWREGALSLGDSQPAATNAAIRQVLLAIRGSLCAELWSKGKCTCHTNPRLHADHLVTLTQAVVETMGKPARVEPVREPVLVRRAREFLLENSRRPYRLKELTQAVGVEQPYYLLSQFNLAYGVSPGEFHRRVLVSKTREALLENPRLPLETVALNLGWPGRAEHPKRANRLIEHFRRCLGLTPDKFRRDLRTMPSDWSVRAKTEVDRACRVRNRTLRGGTHALSDELGGLEERSFDRATSRRPVRTQAGGA